jgi:lipoprotein-anchoring transpeptidase ErfK/SrfK
MSLFEEVVKFMESLIRSSWFRRVGTFWVAIALIAFSFFTGPAPSVAAPRSQRERQTSVYNRRNTARLRVKRNHVGGGRWIEVNLSQQRLTAWENGRRVYSTRISSGKRATPTRRGVYTIQSKHRAKTMRGRGYVAPNVPYTMFYSGGYAIHGAYWHNRFGTPVSHGCVNLPVGQARRLFSWASVGTRVVVR